MMKIENLEKGKKYSHDEVKHLFPEFKPNRPERARVNTFSEIDEKSKNVFIEIAKQIQEKFPDSVVYAVGSRINGNWIETSDYDVNIYLPKEQWDEAKKLQFDYKVDMHFKVPHGIVIRQIV